MGVSLFMLRMVCPILARLNAMERLVSIEILQGLSEYSSAFKLGCFGNVLRTLYV